MKGRILHILFCALLLQSVWVMADVSADSQELQFSFKSLNTKSSILKSGATSLVIPELAEANQYQAVTSQLGYPLLPAVRFYITGDVVVSVASEVKEYKLRASQEVQPVTESVAKLPGTKDARIKFASIYQSNSLWPVQSYTVEDAGSVRGIVRKMVTLYPVAYNPATKQLVLRQGFTVKTKSTEAKGSPQAQSFAFVVGSKFATNSALQSYVQLKQQQGFKTYLGVVGKDFSSDVQIRDWLRAIWAKDNSLRYALLVGDVEDVPSHTSSLIRGVTDHFYRSLDRADYSSDINGPDISVGRLSVATADELTMVIAKLTKYAKGTFSQDNGWQNRASFIATDDRWEIAEGSHNYAISNYTASTGYKGYFPRDEMQGGDQLYAITQHARTEHVLKAISDGAAIIDYSGHGLEFSWHGPSVSQEQLRRSLVHPDAMPFVISNACITAQFTETESFSETWLRHPRGAIMFWGSMDNTYWEEDDILEKRMFDGIFKDGIREFGKITENALSKFWLHYGGEGKSRYYWETYVTMGDPSLTLRLNR